MTNIINLMTELNVSDDTITKTLTKVTLICSKYENLLNESSSNTFTMAGNGNGNN